MYTACLEENAKNGLVTDVDDDMNICDVQYKERECLYVDGAAWLALDRDWFTHFVELTLNTAFANLEIFGESVGYYILCKQYDAAVRDFSWTISEYGNIGAMISNSFCHSGASLLTLAEVNFFTDGIATTSINDWDFEANLEAFRNSQSKNERGNFVMH